MDNIKIAKALGDPIRYKILLLMMKRSETGCCSISNTVGLEVGVCNCEIMARFGFIQSKVSYHMKELVEAGLVNEKPRGKWKFYTVNSDTLKQYIEQLKGDFSLE